MFNTLLAKVLSSLQIGERIAVRQSCQVLILGRQVAKYLTYCLAPSPFKKNENQIICSSLQIEGRFLENLTALGWEVLRNTFARSIT